MRSLLILVLVLSLTTLSLTAQTRGGLDSLYGVTVPYTKEVQDIGRVGYISLSIIRITPDDGDPVKFGRIETTSASSSTSTLSRALNRSTTLISREDLQYLHEQLQEYFVHAGSTAPQVYTEKVDLIRGPLVNLEISLFHSGSDRGDWILQLDAGRYTDRNGVQIDAKKIPELAKVIQMTIDQL